MRTLVLDLGGVFYLGKPGEALWKRAGTRTGLDPEKIKQLIWNGADIEAANVGKLTGEEYFARAAKRLDTEPEIIRAIVHEAFVSEFNHELASFARDQRKRGVAVSALTNSWSREAELKARAEFVGMFDHVVSSADAGCAKPGEEIYRVMLTRLAAAPDDVVFVDDTLANVETARALGIQGIHFQETAQAIAEIEHLLG